MQIQKPDLQGKYFENTIVIQYGTNIIEAYDEAKRLRCEWFEAYEKPATFRPAIPKFDAFCLIVCTRKQVPILD
ncbi:hypothetical protein DERF_009834 [Dermatophagoides farinae]|uniref:Uncharacterized protein n=1 Tax=Dermatophagoides farinae TaxID=6954 RepID=A0A922HZZ1_DERFA|nr:hypothetical protein DERF_009834 [Dermatophagoides farinae]